MISIRNAVGSDLEILTNVFVACFNEPPWSDGWTFEAARERLQAMLESRLYRGAIAFINECPVGLILGQKERWVDSFHFNVQEMCVLSAYQRQGVGRALVNQLQNDLHREGVAKMYLITGPNGPAAAFYGALGFYPSRSRVVLASLLNGSQP